MQMAMIRSKREFQKCSSLQNFKITLQDDNLLFWNISYTPSTNIFKKTYNLTLKIPDNYPFASPELLFTEYMYHPNVDKNGKMCLSILTDWQSSYSINILLDAFHTRFTEPDLENPTNVEACKMFQENLEGYRKKI